MGTGVKQVGEIRTNHFFHNQWQVGNFLPQKPLKAGGEVLLHLYYGESCFWAKAPRVFKPFGWLLTFAKAIVGWKAQPNTP
jgi:hypothetical protein